MGFISRFFGKGEKSEAPAAPRVADPPTKNPLGLQILFAGALPMDFDAVAMAIHTYDPSMARARCDLRLAGEGNLMGVADWGKDVVEILGIGAPMPAAAVKACVAPAHYDVALKKRAIAHGSHALFSTAAAIPRRMASMSHSPPWQAHSRASMRSSS